MLIHIRMTLRKLSKMTCVPDVEGDRENGLEAEDGSSSTEPEENADDEENKSTSQRKWVPITFRFIMIGKLSLPVVCYIFRYRKDQVNIT
ncbi:hypothetical protein NQ315_015105 [Exocentrus adspersus]|uniref:Uncharacterized protein n=1 Tax=Exocentrus adspersus TaxID=1586481 RepID=A0AAV8VX63_9CUCU|nr:hypothetical protein NQ315_015105 [Exocentrus adspersus]